MTQVSRLLAALDDGNPQAAEQLLPLVYDQLRHQLHRHEAASDSAR